MGIIFTKTRPVHKAPYFGAAHPFRSSLIAAKEATMQTILAKVCGQSYKPFFGESEIDKLFSEEVVRSTRIEPVDEEKWKNLLARIAADLRTGAAALRTGPEAVKNYQTAMRRAKITEDFIHALTRGPRLRPEYQKAGRPEIIKTIYVIEDYPDILQFASLALAIPGLRVVLLEPEKRPYESQVADRVRNHKIDLIFMDGDLGRGISGWDLTEQLRGEGFSGYIVAFSNRKESQDLILEAGADFQLSDKATGLLTFREEMLRFLP